MRLDRPRGGGVSCEEPETRRLEGRGAVLATGTGRSARSAALRSCSACSSSISRRRRWDSGRGPDLDLGRARRFPGIELVAGRKEWTIVGVAKLAQEGGHAAVVT